MYHTKSIKDNYADTAIITDGVGAGRRAIKITAEFLFARSLTRLCEGMVKGVRTRAHILASDGREYKSYQFTERSSRIALISRIRIFGI